MTRISPIPRAQDDDRQLHRLELSQQSAQRPGDADSGHESVPESDRSYRMLWFWPLRGAPARPSSAPP
jgi:hypothetical protein